jgi:hypothetical protein
MRLFCYSYQFFDADVPDDQFCSGSEKLLSIHRNDSDISFYEIKKNNYENQRTKIA